MATICSSYKNFHFKTLSKLKNYWSEKEFWSGIELASFLNLKYNSVDEIFNNTFINF